MNNTSQKTALITGAGTRLGKHLAITLAKQGYNIALHYNSSDKEALETQKNIQKSGQSCIIIKSNFLDPSQVSTIIPEALDAFGRLDILINNAAIFERCSFEDMNQSIFDNHFNINFKTPVMLTNQYVQQAEQGCIINILDTDIHKNNTRYFPYHLSKRALAEFTVNGARALKPTFRMNGIAPGVLLPRTEKSAYEIDMKYIETLKGKNPLRRIAQLDEIDTTLSYFINNQTITGQIIHVDGGEHLI